MHCTWRKIQHCQTFNLSLLSPDGDQGFPGDVLVSVTYTLGEATLDLKSVRTRRAHPISKMFRITAMTTKTTVLNVTNHTYFNLGDNDTIVDHWVELPSKRTTGLCNCVLLTSSVQSRGGRSSHPNRTGGHRGRDSAWLDKANATWGGFHHSTSCKIYSTLLRCWTGALVVIMQASVTLMW